MSYGLDEHIVPMSELKKGKQLILLKPDVGNNFNLNSAELKTVEKVNVKTVKFEKDERLFKKEDLAFGVVENCNAVREELRRREVFGIWSGSKGRYFEEVK